MNARHRRAAAMLLSLALGSIIAHRANGEQSKPPRATMPPAGNARAFEPAQDNSRVLDVLVRQVGLRDDLETIGASAVNFDPVQLLSLRRDRARTELRGVPIGANLTEDFVIEPVSAFTADARIIAVDANGNETPQDIDVALYRGVGVNDPDARLFMSTASNGAVWMRVQSDAGKFVIAPVDLSDATAGHLMTNAADIPAPPAGTFCSPALPPGFDEAHRLMDETPALRSDDAPPAPALNGQMHELVLMIDINYGLYLAFNGDLESLVAYIEFIVSEASVIYENELGIRLAIGDLYYWPEPDPFYGSDTGAQLDNYAAYHTANNTASQRHVAVMLANEPNYGGRAFQGTVCNPDYSVYRYAVCNLALDTYAPSQGYSFDVFVIAHELGHAVGSPHTHGYQPPIDCCQTGETCSYQQPAVGTIMSYCHLEGNYGIDMTFHQRVRDQITAHLSQFNCLNVVGGGGGGGTSDDAYEPNNTWEQVRELSPGTYNLMGLDSDLFFVHVDDDGQLTVNIAGPQGDLDLLVYSLNAELGRSESPTSNESVSIEVSPGDYYIDIEPYDNQVSAYTLTISFEANGSGGPADDNFEPNDNGNDAKPISTGQHELVGLNDDWFYLDVAEAGTLTVTIDGPQADLDLYLGNETEWFVDSTSPDSTETATTEVTEGRHYILVTPASADTTTYDLTVSFEAADNGGGGGGDSPTDDDYEPNDNWQSARGIPTGSYQLRGFNPDWFKISVSRTTQLNVSIEGLGGNLDLYIASNSNVLDASQGLDSNESVSAFVQPGTYYIMVIPRSREGSRYRMNVSSSSSSRGDFTQPFDRNSIRNSFGLPADSAGEGGGTTNTIENGGSTEGTTVTTGDAACGTGMATATPIGVIGLMAVGLCGPGRSRTQRALPQRR